METYNVAVLIGSLSSKSINRKLFRALDRLSEDANLKFTEIPIGGLPLYSPDFDSNYPQVAVDMKEGIAGADAVMVVSPEYNRSIPAPLKNALDWASRPAGSNSFNKVPAAIIGASPGALRTAIAQEHIRTVLSFLNSPTLNHPGAYIHDTPGLITEDGEITNESTKRFLNIWLKAFHDHIEHHIEYEDAAS